MREKIENYMENTPINRKTVSNAISSSGITDLGYASIREIVKLVNILRNETGVEFIRMEMGVPGLPSAEVGVNAEIDALRKGVASIYPDIEGLPEFKTEASRFVKLFLDIDVSPECCVPTAGSMMGGMASFMVANRNDRTKEGTLFIDPGFPVQKTQTRILGQDYRSFDVYNYRGEKLGPKLESMLECGKVSTILYSNPNNPSWICFTEDELRTIGRLAARYDVIVVEDLAYFGMDFRTDYSRPGVPPYQPTVAKYCDDYILLISGSKVFSYAGQRAGLLVMSDHLYNRRYPDLLRYYSSDLFGRAMIFGALYALSSGVAHSVQYGFTAILKAVNEGIYNFVENTKEYGLKAAAMKDIFIKHGFTIVYDRDIEKPLADGFYFTISYPGFSGAALLQELLAYGIAAITLNITGSERTEGLRACVSQVRREQLPVLDARLRLFSENNPVLK
jgi:aspartate/methionine/tyrosine aminotransferase